MLVAGASLEEKGSEGQKGSKGKGQMKTRLRFWLDQKQTGSGASQRAACLLLVTEGLNHNPRAVKNDSRSFASQSLE